MSTAEAWIPEDTFAARLALIRTQLRLNVKQAAERCEISEVTWRSWERGARPQAMDKVVRKIADKLGADPNWLMWGGALTTTCSSLPSLSLVPLPDGQMELPYADQIDGFAHFVQAVATAP